MYTCKSEGGMQQLLHCIDWYFMFTVTARILVEWTSHIITMFSIKYWSSSATHIPREYPCWPRYRK